MTQQIKEYSDNQGNHHDDGGAINYDAKENWMGGNEDFYGFDENEDVTSEALPIMETFLCQVLASSLLFFE